MRLLDFLLEQKNIKLKGSLYHKTQVAFAYNSNRIEGSRLTEDETRMIFETQSIIGGEKSTNVNDIVETANHFYLFDVMLDHADDILNEELVKRYHAILKNGTVDSRNSWFAVGDYKKHENEVGGVDTTPVKDVAKEMGALLGWFNSLKTVAFVDVVEFHYRFECIHPFQDGNGRIGRLLMFQQCLKHDIVPFIVDDEFKAFYYRGLSEYKNIKEYLIDTLLTMQDRYKLLIQKFVG